jgi:hypothetical protein
MGFFTRFFNLFSGKPAGGSSRYLPIYVLSRRCREPIAGQLDLMNETSLDDDGGYYVRKGLHTSGKNRCFDQVEVEIWLNTKKQIVRQEVHGGQWLTAEEYEAEVDRQTDAADTTDDEPAET